MVSITHIWAGGGSSLHLSVATQSLSRGQVLDFSAEVLARVRHGFHSFCAFALAFVLLMGWEGAGRGSVVVLLFCTEGRTAKVLDAWSGGVVVVF